ncbi:MAG TPA: DUF4870 domain-containing protein [Candidatus Cybelea sp.]|nr:DUF4870 domain-containing protein [Candidatus Cybelea sp.]
MEQQVKTVGSGATAAMWCHLSAICGIIPFCNIIAPLIVWQSTNSQGPEVDPNGKEAVNFQMTMSAVFVSVYVATVVLSIFTLALPKSAAAAGSLVIFAIEMLLYSAVVIFWLIVVITAAVRASQGETYRYPLSIRLIR